MNITTWLCRGAEYLPKERLIIRSLPFRTISDLFIDKLRCSAQRNKSRDGQDIIWLIENEKDKISVAEVRSQIKEGIISVAIENHPTIADKLASLGLDVSMKSTTG